MRREEQFGCLIEKYEKEYIEFMEIESFPKYKLELFEIKVNEVDAAGFGALAQATYNPKTDEHILRICINLELMKYIVFHEFTHILDAEMYAKRDSVSYAYLSGYHCSAKGKDLDFQNRSVNVDHQLLRDKEAGYYIALSIILQKYFLKFLL